MNLNVGHLMLLLQFGNMSKDLCRYNTQMFAQQVMPKMQGLFSEWEDRWWPQPMAAAQRAAVPAYHAQAGGGIIVSATENTRERTRDVDR